MFQNKAEAVGYLDPTYRWGSRTCAQREATAPTAAGQETRASGARLATGVTGVPSLQAHRRPHQPQAASDLRDPVSPHPGPVPRAHGITGG